MPSTPLDDDINDVQVLPPVTVEAASVTAARNVTTAAAAAAPASENAVNVVSIKSDMHKPSMAPVAASYTGTSSDDAASTPVEAASLVAPPASGPVGISTARYLSKLEECAALHEKLSAVSAQLRSADHRYENQKKEEALLRHTVEQLQDVLVMRTAELSHAYDHIRELQRHTGGGCGSSTGSAVQDSLGWYGSSRPSVTERFSTATPAVSFSLSPPLPPLREAPRRLTATTGASATAAAASTSAPSKITGPYSTASPQVLLDYVCASCHYGCPTHPQLVEGLYHAAPALVATKPPLTYPQWTVLHRLIVQDTASSFGQWARHNVQLLSVRFEDTNNGLSVIDEVLHRLTSLRELELHAIDSNVAMQRLADAISTTLHITTLSLPELSVEDDGLEALWCLMRRRHSGTGSAAAEETEESVYPPEQHLSTATPPKRLCIHTLDLNRCRISSQLTVSRLYAPGVEVLLLPPTDSVTDSSLITVLQHCTQMHTLDISGCVRLTKAVIRIMDTHEHLRVLCMEHCPHIRTVELNRVEVLLSSLVHVTRITMPQLRALPLPLKNRSLMRHIYAPRLEHVVLEGMILDGEVMAPLLVRSTTAGSPLPPQLTSVIFSDCIFPVTDGPHALSLFFASQTHLRDLRLYRCKGIPEDVFSTLCGSSLVRLDVVDAGTLTDRSIGAIVTVAPALQHLVLHGAGCSGLTDVGVRRLTMLTELRSLNLLGLDQTAITGVVVAATACCLPHLQLLQHETAVVSNGRVSANGVVPLRVEREDTELRWRTALQTYPVQMLRLQQHSALSLWGESTTPSSPALLFPLVNSLTGAASAGASRTVARSLLINSSGAATTTSLPVFTAHDAPVPREAAASVSSSLSSPTRAMPTATELHDGDAAVTKEEKEVGGDPAGDDAQNPSDIPASAVSSSSDDDDDDRANDSRNMPTRSRPRLHASQATPTTGSRSSAETDMAKQVEAAPLGPWSETADAVNSSLLGSLSQRP